MGTMKQNDTTAAIWQERKARAIAFLRDKPKAGKGWASKTYEYDKAPPEATGARGEGR